MMWYSADQARHRPLSPLRLVSSLPYSQAGIAFEEPHDAAKPFFPLGMFGVDFRQFLEIRCGIHARAGGGFHVQFFSLCPFRIPGGVFLAFFNIPHWPGANEGCTAALAEFFEGEFAARCFGIRGRRNCETFREQLSAVDRKHVLGRDDDLRRRDVRWEQMR